MSIEWRNVLKTKTASIFATDGEREAARAVLAPVVDGVEGERVAVSCLKLSDGDLLKLKDCASAALTDYRDILAWAESPRQMRIGPSAPPAERVRARRADAEEYALWIKDA
jgi:hypothetical protein